MLTFRIDYEDEFENFRYKRYTNTNDPIISEYEKVNPANYDGSIRGGSSLKFRLHKER
jgi:hypothetical protein